MRLALALGLAMTLGCERRADAPSPYVDRHGLGTPLGEACASLRAQGCDEGESLPNGLTCYEHLARLSGRIKIPAKCVTDAKSAQTIRGCGLPSELRFECMPAAR